MQPCRTPTIQLDPVSVEIFCHKVERSGLSMSKTSICELRRCPTRWAYRTILGFPEHLPGPALQLGSACHKVVAERLSPLGAAIADGSIRWPGR